ncbi:tetratricopeptide repeat protein [Plasmopara halstedii]|uniref:Tetratricopeptide repeat protein n=1 Tax=Plasmopara halstedii TaxID=4781 RepID=A0A0P1B5B7_PLAHL|nr:tetratricopeptide repeat protein [Plasmopara halstedii]CEG49541.1 tetratricopeptide repeat protein [Plasmopara halstedii]|eukprot:XP_024585910.1 tetratricopeptide repeat protein [Plasmopara halstedii]
MMSSAFAAKLRAGAKATKSPLNSQPNSAEQPRSRPNEAIFNTQFTTAGKRFLTKIKKSRALQVDRRTRGFQHGLDKRSVVLDPFTKSHYRILLVDPEMMRRENLADELEQRFEIFVAPNNERAFALIALFQINLTLLRLEIGHDQTAATSSALTFLQEMKRMCFRTPVAAIVATSFDTDHEVQKLLARALQQGGVCGFFEEGLGSDVMTDRIAKILRSVTLVQNELSRCREMAQEDQKSRASSHIPSVSPQVEQHELLHATKTRTVTTGSAPGMKRLPMTEAPSARPSTVTFDRPKMLLELSLNQRKQCLRQLEALQTTRESIPHSVLGVHLKSNPASSEITATPLSRCNSSLSPGEGQLTVTKTIPPLPSPKQLSKLIYTRPHELQTRIGRHLYEQKYVTGPSGPVPQDPLLNHCVVIDPRAQGRDLLIGKAYMLYCEQRYDEALLHCDRALGSPNLTLEKLARLLRGALYDICGNHARAEADFLACLQIDPSMHEALFNLSVARLKLGKDALALEALSQALTVEPHNDKYLQNRGLIYRRMGHYAQAQSEYDRREINFKSVSGPLFVRSTLYTSESTLSNQDTMSDSPPSSYVLRHNKGALSTSELEDGLYAHLFGKPTPDKLALACPPTERCGQMLSAIVARLQTLLFFQDFPHEMLVRVAQSMDYDVIACGKRFVLGEMHSQNFYVLLEGRLSIRRQFGVTDFNSTVTTHHLGTGSVFGCAGFTISTQASLIADESAEIGILWPDVYEATIRAVTSQINHDIFAFLQQLRGFRLLPTSELGHIVGISERKRYRKGEILLEQNEQPRFLIVLWKGSCSVYQNFNNAPLSRRSARQSSDRDDRKVEDSDETGSDSDSDDSSDSDTETGRTIYRRQLNKDIEQFSLPFHHLIAKPHWPLGFQTRTRARKYRRGRRDGFLLSQMPPLLKSLNTGSPSFVSLPVSRQKKKNRFYKKNALVQKCVAPAVFGESRFLGPTHSSSKCCIIAESLVEVLLFDHMRLQEMGLQPDVVSELFDVAPKYRSEKEVAQKQADTTTWNEYRSLRLLELSKKRWPDAKRHLRALSNGCSIILPDKLMR